ncbi:MAG TPA: class I SAM-dependent methyltransferase [Micropepsaceae bacterium]|nr:class I SAM-dependent methyltransferase [Micropepsaceae bacterium]
MADLREDLVQLAEHGFHTAARLCKSCYHYHALWGYERLAGIKSNGFETERDLLEPLLNSELPETGRVLIAGVADAGLLAFTATTIGDKARSITVADRCPTPLEVCRRYGEAHRLNLSTEVADLTLTGVSPGHDLAFAHNVLMLQPLHLHAAFLEKIRRSLSPHGKLILVNRVRSGEPRTRLPPEHYATRMIEALSKRGIALPEPVAEFRKRLETYAERQHVWSDAVVDLPHVERAFAQAGFRILERIDHDRRRTIPDRDGGPPMPMLTNIFIARAR